MSAPKIKMENLNATIAKSFSKKEFSVLKKEDYEWNILHSEGIIYFLDKLNKFFNFNIKKLIPLAWIHDVGKVIEDKNHAEYSLELLKKSFNLDEIELDCILNHGSGKNPKTNEGRIFRYSDGLSLFYPEAIKFKIKFNFDSGKTKEEIKEDLKKTYEKYKQSYTDSKEVLNLLKQYFILALKDIEGH